MGFVDVVCQLCGVSFGIARIRRADEPQQAAWPYYGPGDGSGFVDDEEWDGSDGSLGCGPKTGCSVLARDGQLEHLAGPGCVFDRGYSGYRITTDEMKGCQALQCLIQKDADWTSEEGDQDFEASSEYFLSGVQAWGGLDPECEDPSFLPVRHGVQSAFVYNTTYPDDEIQANMPFHPTCFTIFTHVSKLRLGRVDIDGLAGWFKMESSYEAFFEQFPRAFPVKHGCEEYWRHDIGAEYLAANPLNVPGLETLIAKCCRKISDYRDEDYQGADADNIILRRRTHLRMRPNIDGPLKLRASRDPFQKLSQGLVHGILDYLSSKELARVRLATRCFWQFPESIFRRFLHEDMPWLWEVWDIPSGGADWYALYLMAKFFWYNLKGLQKRKMVWHDVEEIVRRIGRYRKEGKIE